MGDNFPFKHTEKELYNLLFSFHRVTELPLTGTHFLLMTRVWKKRKAMPQDNYFSCLLFENSFKVVMCSNFGSTTSEMFHDV